MSYEPRILEIERRLEQLRHELGRMQALLTETQQSLNRAWMNSPAGGSGGGGQALWTISPGGGIAAATGTWPTLTPTTFTAAIYSDVGGTLTEVTPSATVRWFYKDTDPGNRLLAVFDNGDGSYDIVVDSCTRVDV